MTQRQTSMSATARPLAVHPYTADTCTVYSSASQPTRMSAQMQPPPTTYRPGPVHTGPQQLYMSSAVGSNPACMQIHSSTLAGPPPSDCAVMSMLPCQLIVPGESAFVDNAV